MRKKQKKVTLTKLNNELTALVEYFTKEFGNELHNNKLILKLHKCGKKGCKYCPHGPYWYRALFNTKTRRWIFKYINCNLTKGMLVGKEIERWNRYNFFNKEAIRIRSERQKALRQKNLIQA